VVYAVDVNPAQVYEVRLKLAAMKELSHADFLTLLGFQGNDTDRFQLFQKISPLLDEATRRFWERHRRFIRNGVSFQGWMEQFYTTTGRFVRLFLSEQYEPYLRARTREERQAIFDAKLNTATVKTLTKIIMNNRLAVNVLYKHQATKNIPSTFDYQACSWRNFHHAFVDIGCEDNPYLTFMFTGRMPQNRDCWPPYLHEEHYETIRHNLDAVKILNTDLITALHTLPDHSINAYSLSDVFDWMNLTQIETVLQAIARTAAPQARLITFILNYDKGLPPATQHQFTKENHQSQTLQASERLGFYAHINLYHVNND